MSEFKLRNKPKTPTMPKSIEYDVGDYIGFADMVRLMEEFKEEHSDRHPEDMYVQVDALDYSSCIMLCAPPESQKDYEAKLEAYKMDLKSYKRWQATHKKEIEKAKVKKKKDVAKRKLERTKKRLSKEMDDVVAKLEKA